ncbi:hypothetical protein HanPI659440_Chr14g0556841 [Helianthus annuus]|nr:hypothetical protein HanPI659440_Chr14g0556841 [Helianthus annuus]
MSFYPYVPYLTCYFYVLILVLLCVNICFNISFFMCHSRQVYTCLFNVQHTLFLIHFTRLF